MNTDKGIDEDERIEKARTAECERGLRKSKRDPSPASRVQDDDALRMGARKAGAGAGGHAAGVALRTIVGLVAGDVHFEQGAGGDVQLEASAAAVNDGAGGYGQAAFLFDYADGFARGAAGGPDVFDDEDAFAGLQLEAAAQRHLAGAIALDEKRANAEGAGDFVADNQATE